MGVVILVVGAVVVFLLLNQKPPEQFDPLKDLLGELKKAAPLALKAAGQLPDAVSSTGRKVLTGVTSGAGSVVKGIRDLF